MKKILLVVLLVLAFVSLPAMAEEQKAQPAAEKSGPEETVVKSYYPPLCFA